MVSQLRITYKWWYLLEDTVAFEKRLGTDRIERGKKWDPDIKDPLVLTDPNPRPNPDPDPDPLPDRLVKELCLCAVYRKMWNTNRHQKARIQEKLKGCINQRSAWCLLAPGLSTTANMQSWLLYCTYINILQLTDIKEPRQWKNACSLARQKDPEVPLNDNHSLEKATYYHGW